MLSIYNASAGSGKTFTLTLEYIKMLLNDKQQKDHNSLPHSRILAVTFTKKATAEMKERILKELYIISTTPEKSDYAKEILKTSRDKWTHEKLKLQAKKLLTDILQDYSRFSISTIDSFFQQVIRTFARELGLSATYDLALDGEEIIQDAVDEIFKRIRENKDEDKDLVKWMIDFIQNNIEEDNKWNPNKTIKQFSKQLLQEQVMRRMDDLQKVFEDKDFMRQYRSQLQQICKNSEQQVKQLLQQASSILASEEGWNKDIYPACQKSPEIWLKGEQGKTFFNIIENPTKIINKSKTSKAQQEVLLNLYAQQLEPIFQDLFQICTGTTTKDYVSAKEILPNLYSVGILQDVSKQIATTNRNIGRLPISEINQLLHQIIENQETPFIYERIGQYFHHYMIDEFQDTSALQWENFLPLIHENESYNRDNLIVGDVKQSIYRFRNSDWSLLKNVPSLFAKSEVIPMPKNWRTAPVIVEENEKLMEVFSKHIANKLNTQFKQDSVGNDIEYIFEKDSMHQEAAKATKGYFHLQFFQGNEAEEQTLHNLHIQLQALQAEGIDLKRVTLLVRFGNQAAILAKYLIEKGYNVQSSEGLKIGAHPIIKTIICLLKQQGDSLESIDEAYIKEHYGTLTEQQHQDIIFAQQLPLYEQVQMLIKTLQLTQQQQIAPYITSFLDLIYQFSKSRVADRKSFIEYWERKGQHKTIPSSQTTDSIRIITIHSSKGLEFDIVFIPFFTWELTKTRENDIIWCEPKTAPFNQLPLVAVHPSKALLQSHFKNEYIQEQLSQAIDNLNLTYVAITRPKYRLYIYGQINRRTTNSVGAEVFSLYKQQLNDQLIYRVPDVDIPDPLPPLDDDDTHTLPATYVQEPINSRLELRSRTEDDFAADTPLAIVDLGILMHLWLSHINTWKDAEPTLKRLILQGQVTQQQALELQKQLQQLQTLIQRENHSDWFSDQYTILSEQDIITQSGNIQRPDRVMISGNHAIVIDYKFGYEQPQSHLEQVRDYMLLLNQMGYTAEGHIIYVALNKIHSIK